MHKFYKIAAGRALRTHLPIHAGANVYLPRSFNQLFKYDLSEITGLDDLHNPSGFIKQAQAEAAELFLVEHSFFSVNGASACLMAACLALGEGGKVLVPVNAHKSIIAGLLLSGADPIWYEPDWDAEWGVYRDINPEKIADLLKRHKNIKGCFITSPTYEGIRPQNLSEIISLCQQAEVPTIVDESHGAHLSLLYEGLGGINACADIIVHSPHKSLGALTQTGLLHIQSELISPQKIASALSLLQTTSPSFLLILSLVQTLKSLKQSLSPLKKQMWLAQEFKDRLSKMPEIQLVKNDDPTRLLLAVKGWFGVALSEWLWKNHQIETELEHNNCVLFLIGLGAKWHQLKALQKALKLAQTSPEKDNYKTKLQVKPQMLLCKNNPREAYLKSNGEEKIVFKCPPGVPSQIPGCELPLSLVYSKKANTNPYFEEDFAEDPEDSLYAEEFA